MRELDNLMKGILLAVKDAEKAFAKGGITTENMFKGNHLKTATTAMQETLADLGFYVPLSRVGSYEKNGNYVVVVSLGKNLVSGSTDIEVNKQTRILKISAAFESKDEKTSVSEKAEFSISIPEGFELSNPVAEQKDGNLEITFEKIREEKDTVKVKVTE